MGGCGAATESMGASLGHEPGLNVCPGMFLTAAVTSPGPRCPLSPAQHLVCSKRGLIHLCPWSSSLLRGLFTVSECVNPIKEGGHGLWGPLSRPGPPEVRPQEADPPQM